MIGLFKKLLYKEESKQTTFCYCPDCESELIGNGNFLEDKELVTFKCNRCSTVSNWLFDAPAPILIYVNGQKYEHARCCINK